MCVCWGGGGGGGGEVRISSETLTSDLMCTYRR